MSFSSRLRQLVRGSFLSPVPRPRRPGCRPRLERLEDRTVPSAGALDPTFGGGRVTTPIGPSDDFAEAVAVQADGKVVAAGFANRTAANDYPYDFALVRYNADGSLDAGFGAGGKVVTAFGTAASNAQAVAIQPDGKIVATGFYYGVGSGAFALARYNANGALDPTFGSGGKVTTDFNSRFQDRAYAVVIQPDGKIVAAGYADSQSGSDFALARYHANGSLDTAFNKTGKATTDFARGSDTAYGVALQADGKIVAAGLATLAGGYDFALARYNANGTPDTGFGNAGKVTTDFGSTDDRAYGVAVQADGRIVAAGQKGGAGYDFALARYNANGSLDAAFGSGGRVTTDFGGAHDEAHGVAIQGDGRIVTAGLTENDTDGQFALARCNANGSPDAAFGSGGRVTTDCGATFDGAFAVALAADGRIVAAGTAHTLAPDGTWQRDFAVARYLPAAPQVGSFTAGPNPVASGGAVTLTAAGVTAPNPGSAVAQVAFYRDSNGDGRLDPLADELLAYGTQTQPGTWQLTLTPGWAAGSYTLFARATDSYGAEGDPTALTLTVL